MHLFIFLFDYDCLFRWVVFLRLGCSCAHSLWVGWLRGGRGGGFGVAPAIEEKVRVALNLSQRGKVFILGLFTYCD